MAQLASLRDQPGTQREYETIFILTPTADSDQIREINTRIRRIIEDEKGSLLRVENWGKRKLAYEIRKHSRGIYMYWRYLSPPQLIAEVERNLRMLDPVIRYMTVRLDQNIDPAARPTDLSDEAFEAAATTIPDEEDIATGRVDRGGDEEGGEAQAAEGVKASAEPKAEAAAAPAEAEAAAAPAEAEAAAAPAKAETAAAPAEAVAPVAKTETETETETETKTETTEEAAATSDDAGKEEGK